MHRFFVSPKDILDDKIIISKTDEAHHLKDVLRLKVGDEVMVSDREGREYLTVIDNFLPQGVILKIKKRYESMLKKKFQVTLACALPKKSNMDDIVDKLTQLGVDKIVPLETERVVVKWDAKKKKLHKLRWEKIALNGSKQCQRGIPPVIEPVTQIKKFLSHLEGFDLKLIPTLGGERKTLKEIFTGSKPKNILVLIGPEGDFTAEEVSLAKEEGCIPVSLGELVLRVETAAIAVASFIGLNENH